jgi:hypothetical protein
MSGKILDEKLKDRYHLLRRVYDETEGNPRQVVNFFQLAKKEGFEESYAISIYDYLRSEGLFGIEGIDGRVSLSHRGIVEVEQSIMNPQKPTEHFPPTIIQNFHAPVGAVQTGGQNNTQNVSFSKNDPIDNIVAQIIEALKASQLPPLDKKEAIHNIEMVQELAKVEKTPDIIKRAKEKLELTQSVIKTGTDLGSLVLPYLSTIAQFFTQ